MSYHELSRKTFISGAAIADNSVVKLGASGVEACGAEDTPLGFVAVGALEAGAPVAVRLINTTGTVEVRASESITAGGLVSPADEGAVKAQAGGGLAIGIALQGAENKEILEIVPVFVAGGGAAAAVAKIDLANGVTGTLAVANGGTGATSEEAAWTALGGKAMGKKDNIDLSGSDVTGTLPLTHGGTGATDQAGAKSALGIE